MTLLEERDPRRRTLIPELVERLERVLEAWKRVKSLDGMACADAARVDANVALGEALEALAAQQREDE